MWVAMGARGGLGHASPVGFLGGCLAGWVEKMLSQLGSVLQICHWALIPLLCSRMLSV